MREKNGARLADLTTLHLGGAALAEIAIETEADLENLEERLRFLGGAPLCIGRGSNILAADGALPVVLVRFSGFQKLELAGEQDGKILVRAGAGVPIARLLRFCLRHGLGGLEGLAGIPGSVGGAVAMNAGSFGTETGQYVHEIRAFAKQGITTYKNGEFKKEYRHISFVDASVPPMILEVIFTLTRTLKNVIFEAISLNFFEKKSRQPIEAWSAGCAFKNPTGSHSAGRLLDMAGFRGKKLGGMVFSEKHANFLVNEGHGSSQAAFDLLAEASSAVYKKFGVRLEPEVRIIK